MTKQKFILKVVLLAVLLIATYIFALWRLTGGYVDPYYPKFTHQASSLILGASRAQEGVVPSIIEEKLKGIDQPVLNFAFKLAQSSYGPIYLDAVKEKITEGTENGLFILSVSPGSIAIPDAMNDTVDDKFDTFSVLARVEDLNREPNYRYIRMFYTKSLYKGFLEDRDPYEFQITHNDGWLEFPLKTDKYEIEEEKLVEWKQKLLKVYSSKAATYKFSKVRFKYLEETIEYLKGKGTVVLVRMPADSDVRYYENIVIADFEQLMTDLAKKQSVPYFSFLESDGKYQTYDGSHLSAEGAVQFTNDLCQKISQIDPMTFKIKNN